MKNILISLFILFVTFSHVSFATEVEDPIVDVNKTKEFGLWRIYNAGTTITILDTQKGSFFRINVTGNNPSYYAAVEQEANKQGYLLHKSGTAGSLSTLDASHPYQQEANQAAQTEISAHLQNGVTYGYGVKRFRVQDDMLIVYDEGDFDEISGLALAKLVLNKFSNGVVYEGFSTTAKFDPTIIINAEEIPGPAKVLGDCSATYSSAEQKLTIPCLSIDGSNAIYEIDLNQTPSTVNFSADLNTFTQVQ